MTPGLAGGVVHLSGVAPEAHHAGEVHDAAVALLHHLPGHGLHAEEGALEVGGDDGVKVLRLHHHQQAVPCDARVVHQNVDAAEGFEGGVHQGLHLVLFRHVAPDGHGLGPKGFAGGNGLIGRRFVARVAEHHVGAAPGQFQADRPGPGPGCRR